MKGLAWGFAVSLNFPQSRNLRSCWSLCYRDGVEGRLAVSCFIGDSWSVARIRYKGEMVSIIRHGLVDPNKVSSESGWCR